MKVLAYQKNKTNEFKIHNDFCDFIYVVDVKFRLFPEEYEPFLSCEAKLQCTVFATVKETKQMWLGKATQSFAPPRIRCRFPSGFQYASVGMCI